MNNNKINTEKVLANKRLNNNRLFESHRKSTMPQIQTVKSRRNEYKVQSSDMNLSNLISQAYSLINSELDRNYRNLDIVRQHSEQLKEEDVIEKYMEAEQVVLSSIEGLEQKRQELGAAVTDIAGRIEQIISDISGVDEGQSREFTKPDTAPVAKEAAKVANKNNSNGEKAFEKALAAKAAGMGVSPDAISKAMKK